MSVIAANRKSLTMLVVAVTIGWIPVAAGDETAEFQVELSDPVAPTVPPRVYRVVPSYDEHGFPAGYALSFTTHVCVDELCRMVKVTMHWNALGSYERLEYPADTPLTKKKHVPFAAADYARLDQILKDRDSILGSQPLEAFGSPVQQPEVPGIDDRRAGEPGGVSPRVVQQPAIPGIDDRRAGEPGGVSPRVVQQPAVPGIDGSQVGEPGGVSPRVVQQPEVPGIDGWSGATPQAVKDAVVDDAAYTSWTMWRWANGEIVPKLQRLTEQRCTPDYLRHLLQSNDRRAVDFALKHILKHRPSDEQFADDVFHVLETGDREHVSLSLQFLDRAVTDKRRLHDRLIACYCRLNSNYSTLVLDYFSTQPDLPAETLEGLTGILNQLPYFQIHLILRLLEKREFFSARVESNVAALLDSPDFFIARRASEHLLKQQLGSETQRKLDAFRQRYRQRL